MIRALWHPWSVVAARTVQRYGRILLSLELEA
jgi:hypothetical protein